MDKIKVELEICNLVVPCIAGIEVDSEGEYTIVSLESSADADVEGVGLTGLLQFEDIKDWLEYEISEQQVPKLRRRARLSEQS